VANDLMVLEPALSLALRDVSNETWTSSELNDILEWSVARLWPHASRQLDPTDDNYIITLAEGTYFYDIHEDYRAVSRLDMVDTNDNELGPVWGRAWEISGDIDAGVGQIHISPRIVDSCDGYTLRLVGYGPYVAQPGDGETGAIPNNLVPLVLALGRAEAYRRLASDRERFKAWLSRNQNQNVSVNELIQLINEADNEAQKLWREPGVKRWQKPVSGRVG